MSALADVVITDEDVDQIEAVGDLIRHIKTWIVRGDDAPSSRRRSSDPQLGPPRFSRGPWSPAEQQDLCEQVGMHTRPATYVEGPAFFTLGPLA